jgi:hypothetical protein
LVEVIVSIKTISSRLVYENRWTRVREDVIEHEEARVGSMVSSMKIRLAL